MGQLERLFFNYPGKDFHIREIARLLNRPKSSVSYRINKLLEDNIIKKNKTGVFTSFRANDQHDMYRFKKRQEGILNIIHSGLIDYLDKRNPRCIILFGSFAKAEYDAESDIDIFVQAKDTRLQLSKYEKDLRRTINVFFEPDLNKLSPELLNNILNGIKLRGVIRIK